MAEPAVGHREHLALEGGVGANGWDVNLYVLKSVLASGYNDTCHRERALLKEVPTHLPNHLQVLFGLEQMPSSLKEGDRTECKEPTSFLELRWSLQRDSISMLYLSYVVQYINWPRI